jgi:hypothetical protein
MPHSSGVKGLHLFGIPQKVNPIRLSFAPTAASPHVPCASLGDGRATPLGIVPLIQIETKSHATLDASVTPATTLDSVRFL